MRSWSPAGRPPFPAAGALMLVALLVLAAPAAVRAQDGDVAVVLRAGEVLDGRGGRTGPRDIVVRAGRIVRVVPSGEGRGGRVYDLEDFTMLPGLIDTHVHLSWHFDHTGKLHRSEAEEAPEESILYSVENAWVTLQGGITTVQSVGSPSDAYLRDAIARGAVPGPRVLTSLRPVSDDTGTPHEIRAFVRSLAADGADVVKIFASASIRVGGTPTMTSAQLEAACAEAARHGLRTLVHAHGPESARRASDAGCTTIEHGALLDRTTLEILARNGTYYDPNIHLIFRNYFENKERFLGVGSYTEEGFAQMERAVPSALDAFRAGLRVPGLEIVFGTDAVAGAHGRNYQELVYRVKEGGQSPMEAVVSATSRAAESLGMADRLGAVRPGMAADLIAVAGSPLDDVRSLGDVVFVMKGGIVYRHHPPGSSRGR